MYLCCIIECDFSNLFNSQVFLNINRIKVVKIALYLYLVSYFFGKYGNLSLFFSIILNSYGFYSLNITFIEYKNQKTTFQSENTIPSRRYNNGNLNECNFIILQRFSVLHNL